MRRPSITGKMCYASGLPYRPISTSQQRSVGLPRPMSLPADADWPAFWREVHTWMKQQGYAHSTARLYRQVLRNFARFAGTPPALVNRVTVDSYLGLLRRGHCSAHWAALNHSVLRTIFDKLLGLGFLAGNLGPRRPHSLPTVLNDSEAQALLDAATTLRERLVLSLLYGCGLTVGELRRLRWENLDPEAKALHAPGDHRLQPRILQLPECLVPIVQAAHQHGSQEVLVLPGGRPGKPLSARWIQCLVRAAAKRAGILKPVSPMVLRHTFAVHCLEAGSNPREVQVALGHASIRTTLRYTECILPPDARSPLDDMRIPEAIPTAAEPPLQIVETVAGAPASSLMALVLSSKDFLEVLKIQLGARLFASRKAGSDPP